MHKIMSYAILVTYKVVTISFVLQTLWLEVKCKLIYYIRKCTYH